MSIVTYNLTDWEQGTINTSGDSSSSTSIRTVGYLEITPNTTVEYKVTAVDTNGNPLRWNPMLYNASKQCIRDGGWQNSGTTWSNTDKAKYVRFCLSYSSGNISPSNLGSCIFEYNDMMSWYVINGEITNTNFIDGIQYAMAQPYPKELWRVTPNIPYPWHELLPMELGLEPLPLNTQGPAQEITDTSSIEYRRYANTSTGYANPNLYRFQDVPFPENVRCSVGIYGTDSYQFTEVILHDEESTTSEIP